MPRVQLENGELRDQIKQDLFDTLIQETATSITGTNEFFTNVQGKAAHLTNLRQNQMLENMVSYLVQGLGFNALVDAAANEAILPLVYDHSSYVFVIGEKEYWRGPLSYVCGNVYQEGGFVAQLGSFDNAKYPLQGDSSIAIPPLQSFKTVWTIAGYTVAEEAASLPAIGTRIHFRARLIGLLRRPVQ